jgi:hypothetical protein
MKKEKKSNCLIRINEYSKKEYDPCNPFLFAARKLFFFNFKNLLYACSWKQPEALNFSRRSRTCRGRSRHVQFR